MEYNDFLARTVTIELRTQKIEEVKGLLHTVVFIIKFITPEMP